MSMTEFMKQNGLGKYNFQICITDSGYQIDFIDPKQYNEDYYALEERGIIKGAICRSYGVDVNQDRAMAALLDFVHELENVEGVELTPEEYEQKEREFEEQFGKDE